MTLPVREIEEDENKLELGRIVWDEEIGGLYATVVVRSLVRLMRERDPFIRLAGTGLACMFGVQAMINMGVAVRLLPAKGMTLPFVSYGGSSLIAGGIAVGMLLAFTRTRPQGEIGDILRGRMR